MTGSLIRPVGGYVTLDRRAPPCVGRCVYEFSAAVTAFAAILWRLAGLLMSDCRYGVRQWRDLSIDLRVVSPRIICIHVA